MALTVDQIHATEDDEALFDLLSAELQRELPKEILKDADLTYEKVKSLPRGLRAMAGMHFFDVSMALDDLAWHFGNQNDERALRETLNGLRELELFEVADCFERAWKLMDPYLDRIRADDRDGLEPTEWYEKIGVQQQIDPMNKIIWDYCEKLGRGGLLGSWAPYARKYPERCVVAERAA